MSSVAWAVQLRAQLVEEIASLSARSRSGDRSAEALGLLPDTDRLAILQHRLRQVERLIDAAELEGEHGWPAHLGDPSRAAAPAAPMPLRS